MDKPLVLVALALLLNGCAEHATLPVEAGMGPNPALPPPNKTLIPTVNIAPAKGWPVGESPRPAADLAVNAFASELDHPRWLYVLPNGDVLVAETNGPPKKAGGFRSWIMGIVMKRAGAAVPSANRITLLRDTDNDGVAETQSAFLQNLNSPFGMALIDDALYVANTDALVKFKYRTGDLSIAGSGTHMFDLPAGTINHHWTKNVTASPAGDRLYVTVGSNSNVAENGIDKEAGRAAIHEIDLASGTMRLYATGLRNPNGLAWQPQSGALWTTVNERDEIGSDLVPDYMTSVKDGGFYGWPYSYYGQNVDNRVKPRRLDLVAEAIKPDYALGAHVAALGLAFYTGNLLPSQYRNGAFVGLHGSWNRSPPSGYKVVFVPFEYGQPKGMPQDVLTGFLSENGHANGRPVGVAVDGYGAVLVADDVGNTVWRIAPAR